jgi:hypothetical protein
MGGKSKRAEKDVPGKMASKANSEAHIVKGASG